MNFFLPWYLAILIIGWIAFPLSHHLLRFLPERGYVLSKALGLLLWGFIFWLMASLHLTQNDGGGIVLSLGLLAGVSAWSIRKQGWKTLVEWLKANKKLLITSEALFLVCFGAWAIVRAAFPEALGTEKPMELAFINAILHSSTFPPHDPWLSGYAISYYYFGYVIVAMLCRITGISGAVGFNLGVASWYGLTATTAYGLLYNLLASRQPANPSSGRPNSLKGIYLWALLAPLFLLIVSNSNGILEVLHADGAFWPTDAQGKPAASAPLWSWLDIQELNQAPATPYSLTPNRVGGIWWWRSSRVLTDYDAQGGTREIIDEFPAFSYILGDLHPHVLSLPFAILAVALALNLYLRGQKESFKHLDVKRWPLGIDFWLAAVVLGGLAFFNTWDFPIYVALFASTFTVVKIQQSGWNWKRLWEFLILAVELAVAGVLLYLPFYMGFASQAGGLLPSLSFFTRGIHFWVMWLPLLLPIIIWLVGTWPSGHRYKLFFSGLGLAAAIVFGLWLLSYAYAWVMFQIPDKAGILLNIQSATDAGMVLGMSLAKRLAMPGMWLSMLGVLALVLGLISREYTTTPSPEEPVEEEEIEAPSSEGKAEPGSRGFVLLMVLVGCGLVLMPEFLYLRDQFGWRMNTIFKFYFQAWMLWSIVAGYASVWLWQEMRSKMRFVLIPVWGVVLASSLLYPVYGVLSRTNNFNPSAWSLDSTDYMRRFDPASYEAIQWLASAPDGVVAEAVGGSYSEFARVATLSGKPDVIGWPGHESQWRGGAKEIGTREGDIEKLYTTSDWDTAKTILQEYGIRYIFIGPMESSKYKVNEGKFQDRLTPVFKNDTVRIYAVPDLN